MIQLRLMPTLRKRLCFWFTVICLVPLVLLTTIIYFARARVVRSQMFDKLSAVSSLRQAQINTTLDHLAKDVSTLACAKSVLTTAGELLHSRRPSEADAAILLQGYQESYDSVTGVSIVARSGAILLSTSASRRGGVIARPEVVASSLRDLAPTYGEVYLSENDSPSIDVAAPISSGNVSVPAAVVVHYNLRKLLYDVMQNRTGMGMTGETVLVNHDVVALTELRGLPNALLKAKLKGRPAQLAAQGQSGIVEADDYRGEQVLAAYTYIPRTGWGLVCKQNTKEVFAPLVSLLWVSYGVAALISMLAFLFALSLSRSISEPLLRLSLGANRLGRGDYGARIVPEGTDELKDLATSFNGMAGALQSKMDAQQGVARVSESLVTSESLKDFFERLLPVLMEVTGARMAAAFMQDQTEDQFAPVHSIGADAVQMRRLSRNRLEGELGIILSCAAVASFRSAGPGNSLRFVTCFGEILPAEILTVPICVDGEIRAFISLACGTLFPAPARDTLEQIRALLDTCFARILVGEDVRRLAEELSSTNAELTQQSEELVQQSTELALQSDELSRRNRELDQQRVQLEQATRLKSEFLSNMSHELRTPLNSVLALSRVLAVHSAERLTDEERGYLGIIERNGKHLLALINDILDLAKIESGRQEVYLETISVETVAAEVVEGLAMIAQEKGIELTLVPQGPLPPGKIDVKMLRQILQNLVGNAVKFPSQGGVTVRLRREEGDLVIEVEDTGIGIAPQHLFSIFQEFRQADGSTSRSFEGTGLGLAIVRKTAVLLGGDVSVQSELHKGSLFSVRLPLDATPRAGLGPAAPVNCFKAPPQRPESPVLVVDDDPEAAALIAEHLGGAGYHVVTATGVAAALRLARESRPFAITLDLMMPGRAGWEFMRELKELPETADIPVLMVSLSEDRERGLLLGAVGVTKPVSRERLVEQFARLAGAGCRLVLVVDDDELDRFSIASILKQNGMDVLLAENGRQALDLAVADAPDLITLDLVMPDLDGAAVLERLRENEATASIPVVLVTPKDISDEEASRLCSGGSAIFSRGGADRNLLFEELVERLGHLHGEQGPSARKGARILIVEDSEAATIQLRFALESAGFSVDAVSGGRHALAYLKTHVPDGIVLDLMMPEVDGFEVLKAVRASALTEKVPVMIMTAKTLSPGEHDRLRDLNVSHLVQKGDVDLQELLRRVYEMLGVVRLFRKEDAPPTPLAAPGAPAWKGDGSLLVVEDNPDNLATIRAVLGKKYRITEATDGAAGLDFARTGSPSLILLDMHLPKMDGLTVLKRLKGDAATAAIPVVALTASAMAGERERLIQAGCAEYLSKPCQIEELLETVQRFVQGEPADR
jgi:CheY-like chemotaxis protein/signal transduction histidine kinase/HAMP domain-containing protein